MIGNFNNKTDHRMGIACYYGHLVSIRKSWVGIDMRIKGAPAPTSLSALSTTLLKNNAKRHCKLLARTRGDYYFMFENLHVPQNKTKSVLITSKKTKECP